MEDEIEIQLNGEPHTLPAGSSVSDLLMSLDLKPGAIVVELNAVILQRVTFDEAELSAGDRVELVHFVGGG